MASITGSEALSSSAIMTIASITTSHSTVTITRRPGTGYGIHVSACVQARSAGPSRSGQIQGTSTPDGQRPKSLVASHRIAMASEP